MKPMLSNVGARLSAILAVAVAVPVLLAASRPVHLELSKSAPADKSTVDAVSEVRLWFSEAPMDMGARTVSLRIVGTDGKVIATGDAVRDPKDAKVYSLALPRGLAPAAYTIEWQTMAPDGDVARGRFGFTVAAR